MKRLSVIIVSYINIGVLKECLDSIQNYNDLEEQLEVIVVDNSPTLELFNYFQTNYDWIIIIKAENNGFGASNNIGAKIAKGKFLLFLNPDTILIEEIFKEVLNVIETKKNVGIAGVKLLDSRRKINNSFAWLDIKKRTFLRNQIIKILNQLHIFLKKSMYISGANMFIEKSIFFRVNGFDENIFMYGEEIDLTMRINEMGLHSEYIKKCKLIHLRGKSTYNLLNAYEQLIDSLLFLSKKNGILASYILENEYDYYKKRLCLCRVLKKSAVLECEKRISLIKEKMEKNKKSINEIL